MLTSVSSWLVENRQSLKYRGREHIFFKEGDFVIVCFFFIKRFKMSLHFPFINVSQSVFEQCIMIPYHTHFFSHYASMFSEVVGRSPEGQKPRRSEASKVKSLEGQKPRRSEARARNFVCYRSKAPRFKNDFEYLK